MSGEWKPGDVAMVTCSDGSERRALFGCFWLDGSGAWVFRDGTRRNADDSQARPLVVIDPEDEESVRRLVSAYSNYAVRVDGLTAVWQAALREFANPTPPKPDEPLGLGAVVEDADGLLWCRDVAGDDPDGPWYRRGVPNCKQYAEITAVRVLSEGVQP